MVNEEGYGRKLQIKDAEGKIFNLSAPNVETVRGLIAANICVCVCVCVFF